MSSSSRSIAAARQKRAGEQSQPMNNSRPVTSISSSSSFAQQYQQPRGGQNIPIGSKNPRIAQSQAQSQGRGQQQQQQQQQQQPTKISVSNAVGLITLRLGKLEQYINDIQMEGGNMNLNSNGDIPPNMKLVSDEVFENIVNRINLLESKLLSSKNTENNIEKLNKEMSEMKGVVANMHSSLFNFINETNEKFTDIETALALIEENAQINLEDPNENDLHSDNIDIDATGTDNVVLEYNESIETGEVSENDENNENMVEN